MSKQEHLQRLGSIGSPLETKVALLLGGGHAESRALAITLAEYGADVAIVYRKAYAKRISETQKDINERGRRCLTIPAESAEEAFSRKVVLQTVRALGRLDIFIDFSSLDSIDLESQELNQNGHGPQGEQGKPSGALAELENLSAALHAIMQSDRAKLTNN